jgi:alkanesulfonate monooxygenase SsuD/methylene tetrahydromethanopterin reductase-like flavin-dependent oxidoreductase (luciferase family)
VVVWPGPTEVAGAQSVLVRRRTAQSSPPGPTSPRCVGSCSSSRGEFHADNGEPPHVTPADGANLEVWVLGSSAGASSTAAAELGLPQFVGTPEAVLRQLRTLRDVIGADELLITTVTHDHADRVRSDDLLARAWQAGH